MTFKSWPLHDGMNFFLAEYAGPRPFLTIKRKHLDRPSFFYFSMNCVFQVYVTIQKKRSDAKYITSQI